MKIHGLSGRLAMILVFGSGLGVGLAIGWIGRGKSTISAMTQSTEVGHWRSSDRSPTAEDSFRSRNSKSFRNGGKKETTGPSLRSAYRNVLHNNMEEERLESFKSLLQTTSPKDFPEIVSLIREIDLRGAGSGNEWSALWAEWGRRDPKAAIDFMRAMDWTGWNHSAPEQAINQTMIYWAATDLNGALRHFETVDIPEGRREGLYGLIRGWSAQDPDGAASWLFKTGLGMDGEYGALVESISRTEGTEAVGSWFEKIAKSGAPQKDIEGLAAKVVGTIAENEPEKAAGLIERGSTEEWAQNRQLIQAVAEEYAMDDPTAAMDWAERIQSGSAESQVLNTWAAVDSSAAIEWLDEHRQHIGHTSLAFNLAYQLVNSDLEAARKVALSIQDPKARDNMLGVIGAKGQH